MPPHCDTLDGPVVKAIKTATEKGNMNYILPWVPENRKSKQLSIRLLQPESKAEKQWKWLITGYTRQSFDCTEKEKVHLLQALNQLDLTGDQ
jgi:hypothetical protein